MCFAYLETIHYSKYMGVFIFITQSISIEQFILPSIRKLYRSFSLPQPTALHATKYGPKERLHDVTCYDVWVSSVGIKHIPSFVRI
jgi:hypothetical protein